MQENPPSTESATESPSISSSLESETPTSIPRSQNDNTSAIRNTIRPREKPPLPELGCILEFHNGPLQGQLSTPYTVDELLYKAGELNTQGRTEIEIVNPKRDIAVDRVVLIKGREPALFRITLPVYADEKTIKQPEKESKIHIASR